MKARKEPGIRHVPERAPRRVEPDTAHLTPHPEPQPANHADLIRSHVLQLQRTVGNQAIGLLIGRPSAEPTVVQREPEGSKAAANPLTTPVSPEEMFHQIVEYQRAIKATPKGASPATSKIDPKGVGAPSGHGTWTGAAIQVLDASGKRVDVGYGMYAGGDHGEIRAIKALEHLRSRSDLAGGTIVVVVEKEPCATCAPALEAFAKDLGLREVKVYAPTRLPARSGKKAVTHKTAAQTSLQGKRPKTTMKLVYSKTVGRSTPSASGGPSGSRAAAAPTGTPKPQPSKKQPQLPPGPPSPAADVKPRPVAKPKPPIPSAPSPGKGKWVAIDVDQKVKRSRVKVNWDLLGKTGTALSGALDIWNALSTLDGAMKKLERIQSGGVDPEIRKILEAIDDAFPTPAELAKDVSNDQFREGVRSMQWLETAGKKWIDDRGRISLPPQFDQQDREWAHATIGYHIAIADNHIDHLEIIEDALIDRVIVLGALEDELTRRVRALYDISEELWERAAAFRYLPFAFEQLGFLALEFEDVARQLGQVDSRVSYRSYEYDKWLRDVTGKDIWRARGLLAEWAPRWAAIGGKVGSN